MQVEIWSDIVCPWCYVGKRRLETALETFDHRDEIDVVWRSFELDPNAPAIREGDPAQHLADKYGMSRAQTDAAQANLTAMAKLEGLDYHLDKVQSGNSFDAHRLLHLAAEHGVQDDAKERFMLAYFTESKAIGDHETLVALAVDAGLDEAEVRATLASDRFADAVRADEQQAMAYGISGVPFFVVDQKYGVSGAQPAAILLQTLQQAWSESHPLTMVTTAGTDATCEGDNCAV
jgi:predicted DsbA family dithiol-disulfide isomerase